MLELASLGLVTVIYIYQNYCCHQRYFIRVNFVAIFFIDIRIMLSFVLQVHTCICKCQYDYYCHYNNYHYSYLCRFITFDVCIIYITISKVIIRVIHGVTIIITIEVIDRIITQLLIAIIKVPYFSIVLHHFLFLELTHLFILKPTIGFFQLLYLESGFFICSFTLRQLIQPNLESWFIVRSQLSPSTQPGSSPRAGLQVVIQSTHLSKGCYPQLVSNPHRCKTASKVAGLRVHTTTPGVYHCFHIVLEQISL